ncbi:MAG TPA: putative peptidoglycan glycosyltransferase FtsW [Acetobacteraceae bacterium]|nr:putative peptidoglycan glycosyltransferase FtsW [Acetobacteraceae bacterium]
MAAPSRADTSLLGRWWWTVDRWTLIAVSTLLGFGYVMVLSASPSVAVRIGDPRDLLIVKQIIFLALSGIEIVAVSLLSAQTIRRIALFGGLIALLLTAFTLVHGVEIKGARRWIDLAGISFQPSEFLKVCFIVVTAWLLSEQRRTPRLPGTAIALGLFVIIVFLLKSQPDVGMMGLIGAIFLAQLYLNGLNAIFVAIGAGLLALGGVGAYMLFQHVRERVADFLHPNAAGAYQVHTALEAFGNGGLFGTGPGEGRIKDILPDAHADFVFAVAGEEFGLLICLLVIGIFAFIVLRGLLRLLAEHDLFTLLAAGGLLMSFGLEAFINMATALSLIPAKGMTLPFISYGGSSMLAIGLEIGMLLALTRRRHHADP